MDGEYGSVGRIPLASRDGSREARQRPVIGRWALLRRSHRRAHNRPSVRPTSPGDPGRFLVYPLIYGTCSPARHPGLRSHQVRRARELRAGRSSGTPCFHRSLLNTVLFTGAAVVLQTGSDCSWRFSSPTESVDKPSSGFVFFRALRACPVAVGAVWKFLYAPFFGSSRRWGRPSVWTPRPLPRSRIPTPRSGDHGRLPLAVSPVSTWSYTWLVSKPFRASTRNRRFWKAPAEFSGSAT